MTQSDWPASLTRTIAGEVRRYRTEHGMSAQQLADRCAGLGLEISRTTIADLENGRRASVSVGELLVLAAALGISPLLLAIPLGRQQEMEILPGSPISTWQAADWWRGEFNFAYNPGQPPRGGGVEALAMHELQNRMIAIIRNPDSERPKDIIKEEKALAGVRRMMRDQFGLIPPPLPPDLAYVDELAKTPDMN